MPGRSVYMIPLNITMEKRSGVTVLSNVFIDNYMKDANDAQIKIYLYLLRMAYDNLPTDISEIADKFNHTEKDVIRALKYWENMDLISVVCGKEGQVTGVILNEIKGRADTDKAFDDTTTRFECVMETSEETAENSVEYSSDNTETDNYPVISKVSRDYKKEKDEYSIEDIKKLKDEPQVSMLINAGSAYIGRPLNPSEIRTVLYIYDRLGFSVDLASFLMEFCIDQGQPSFDYMEQIAVNWYEEGVTDVEKARLLIKKGDKDTRTVMNIFGRTGNVTVKELEYIRRWKSEYGMSMDLISEACERTVLRTDKNRFGYTDRILEDWKEKNVHTLSDVARVDKEFEDSKKTRVKKPDNLKKAAGFEQREMGKTDYDALEKALLKKKRI